MARNPDGPTALILKLAREAPGGVIRWAEAEGAYRRGSKYGACNHMSLGNLLRRHFDKVEGARGFYVLRSTIYNDDAAEDLLMLNEFHRDFGSDEYGRSHGRSPTEYSVVRGVKRMSDIRPEDEIMEMLGF